MLRVGQSAAKVVNDRGRKLNGNSLPPSPTAYLDSKSALTKNLRDYIESEGMSNEIGKGWWPIPALPGRKAGEDILLLSEDILDHIEAVIELQHGLVGGKGENRHSILRTEAGQRKMMVKGRDAWCHSVTVTYHKFIGRHKLGSRKVAAAKDLNSPLWDGGDSCAMKAGVGLVGSCDSIAAGRTYSCTDLKTWSGGNQHESRFGVRSVSDSQSWGSLGEAAVKTERTYISGRRFGGRIAAGSVSTNRVVTKLENNELQLNGGIVLSALRLSPAPHSHHTWDTECSRYVLDERRE
ncbi:hypothetical protein C8R45DRAFT_939499 [Mycena sanguinolenta]|nr:hypothetical protein C8R45DRAFT_939499 [Mycena sanguinolenta]